MAFCILDNDKKTFEYFKKYVQFLENEDDTCHILDNRIQIDEIRDHLYRHGKDENHKDEIDRWIDENARPFREYLNTIKLVYVVWKCMGKEWQNIEFDEFNAIEETLNKLKHKCLDTIF